MHVIGNVRGRRELLAIVRDRFDEQHQDLKGVSGIERVPVPNNPGVTVSYDFLLQLEAEGEEWYRPEGSTHKIKVSNLLDGVEPSDRRSQRRQEVSSPQQQSKVKEHAFISYCHDNTKEVASLRNDLIEAGEKIWWDQEILGGQNWKQMIRRAMKTSYAVILCLSSELNVRVKSGVYSEILDAVREYRVQAPGTVFLIPVRLDSCEIPDVEIDDTRTLDRLHTIDLFPTESRDEGILRLIKALKASPYHPQS